MKFELKHEMEHPHIQRGDMHTQTFASKEITKRLNFNCG